MKWSTYGVALLILFTLNGCTIQLECTLYNNSGQDLIVQWTDEGRVVEAELKVGTVIRLKGWRLIDYQVIFESGSWLYDQPSPDSNFILFSGLGMWSDRVFKAQIEEDGRIYVIHPDQTFPVTQLPKQSERFPLVPTTIDRG